MKDTVSVIIPTYKSGETLTRAIDSVLAQSYNDVEAVVVDDNNPDTVERVQTEALMQKYVDNPKVIYIKHEKNKNGAAARNTAFANSKGSYIAFLDDDDFFLPEKIQQQVDYLNKNRNIGGCYCWRNQFGSDICGEYEGDLSYEILSLDFTPYTSCVMIRRECFESLNGFDESYYRHQDFEFLLRFFERYTMGFVPYVGVIISTNGVNNIPKGQKLVDIKELFFGQFTSTIDRVTEGNKKKRQYIYNNHFARTFKDLLRYGYPVLAFQVYFKYGIKGGIGFWKLFVKLCTNGMKERLKQKNK